MTTTIQAYRRFKPYTHTFAALGMLQLEFKPNAIGDIVCDVESEAAVELLLQTPTGFRIYEPPAKLAALAAPSRPVEPAPPAPRDSRYLLQAGDQALDLRPMSDEALREFCAANKIAVHPNAKGDTIRDKIVAALSDEA